MTTRHPLIPCALAGLLLLASCSDEPKPEPNVPDANFVGQAVGNFTADEWYPGGELGTTDNVLNGSYADETPAVEKMGLIELFNLGEAFDERKYTINTPPFKGWGPAASRKTCFDCHIQYGGHGLRQTKFRPEYGNGYIIQVYYPDAPGSNNGKAIEHITKFTQVMAAHPFLPPVDPDQIRIEWKTVTAMESGLPMQFEDGERYELIYPEVTVPQSAFNTSPRPSGYAVRLLVSLSFSGLGLIDAIPDEALIEQYRREAQHGAKLNPAIWKNGALTDEGYSVLNGRKRVRRFNYDLTEAALLEDAGIWDELGVSRSDLPWMCSTNEWAKAMSENKSVIAGIKANPASPYYADGTDAGIARAIRVLLSPETNQFKNDIHNFEPELEDDNYYAFAVWHRGLSIPRARNLNTKQVQRGKELFMQLGCANCHRPQWKTGSDDNIYAPDPVYKNGQKRTLPRYPNQTIYPYTDFIQHRMCMANDIFNSWCRTAPLWGRGLMRVNTGGEDRLHDCRARNTIEAIMWHAYSKQSDAYKTVEKFYHLKKEDRDAVVAFVNAI
ncbi:hypothetical protein BHU16_04350 [Tannerella sp. oral taxon 808]|nr:hypothetical protein BHU16_04350 [Tannerella sp. oral taxon 808]